jgi:hypothetical protein
MCWEIDYQFLAEQKKAQEARAKEQRDGVIKALLDEAEKQREDTKTEATPVREAAPAK